MSASALYFLSGVVCLGLFAALMYAVYPRAGRAPGFWVRTDGRSEIVALVLVALFVFGVGLVARAFLG